MHCSTTLVMLAGLTGVLAAGTNVQTFTGTLGGAAPPVLEDTTSTRPFSIDGSTFLKKGAALGRSCAIQHNACAAEANSGSGNLTVTECDAQQNDCNAAAAA